MIHIRANSRSFFCPCAIFRPEHSLDIVHHVIEKKQRQLQLVLEQILEGCLLAEQFEILLKELRRIVVDLGARYGAHGPVSTKGDECFKLDLVTQAVGQTSHGGVGYPLQEASNLVSFYDCANPSETAKRFGDINVTVLQKLETVNVSDRSGNRLNVVLFYLEVCTCLLLYSC